MTPDVCQTNTPVTALPLTKECHRQTARRKKRAPLGCSHAQKACIYARLTPRRHVNSNVHPRQQYSYCLTAFHRECKQVECSSRVAHRTSHEKRASPIEDGAGCRAARYQMVVTRASPVIPVVCREGIAAPSSPPARDGTPGGRKRAPATDTRTERYRSRSHIK